MEMLVRALAGSQEKSVEFSTARRRLAFAFREFCLTGDPKTQLMAPSPR